MKIYVIHCVGLYRDSENELTLKVATNEKDAQKEFQKTKKEIFDFYRSELKDKIVFDIKEKNFIRGYAKHCGDKITISLDEIEIGDNSYQVHITF